MIECDANLYVRIIYVVGNMFNDNRMYWSHVGVGIDNIYFSNIILKYIERKVITMNEKSCWCILMVGLPGSGKSTFTKNIKDKNIVIINRDNIIQSIYPDLTYAEAFSKVNQKEVDMILERNIKEAVACNKNIVIDMTNVTCVSRLRKIEMVRDFNPNYMFGVVVLKTPIEECIKNSNKKGIPGKVVIDMANRFSEPQKNEGYEYIHIIPRFYELSRSEMLS